MGSGRSVVGAMLVVDGALVRRGKVGVEKESLYRGESPFALSVSDMLVSLWMSVYETKGERESALAF